jgi:hypothetical protein
MLFTTPRDIGDTMISQKLSRDNGFLMLSSGYEQSISVVFTSFESSFWNLATGSSHPLDTLLRLQSNSLGLFLFFGGWLGRSNFIGRIRLIFGWNWLCSWNLNGSFHS